jgi:hypothetical protein
MWRIVPGVLVLAACLHGQAFRDLLLQENRHVEGIVVDADGKPIAEARIEYSNDPQFHQTDSAGRFSLDTRAPSLVVRKAGFRSEFVRTQDATVVRITLQGQTESRAFRVCSNNGQYETIEGWNALFEFPRVDGIKASLQEADSDYATRSYYVDGAVPKRIRHGSGPLWGSGMPLDADVWRSVRYQESTFEAGRFTITDARGQLTDGKRWRYLGRFGESAEYSDIDEATAKILDQFLDGACLKSVPSR